MRDVVLTIAGIVGLYLFLRETGSEQAALIVSGAAAFTMGVSAMLLRDE